MVRPEQAEISPFLLWIGPKLSWLKKWWILTCLTLVGGVVAALGPLLTSIPDSAPVRIIAGVAAALALAADKLADHYDKKAASATFRESERLAEKAILDLNVVLGEAIEVTFLSGASRREAIKSLRRTVARQAASAVGAGSRATYYTLARESGGKRILKDAVHGVQPGRFDQPMQPFIEKDDEQLNIWRVLDRADEEAEVVDKPAVVPGLNWDRKKYATYYSVPVKAKQVQLGLLSVNNTNEGAIGGPARSAVLAMARTMALVVAAEKGQGALNTQMNYHPNVGG